MSFDADKLRQEIARGRAKSVIKSLARLSPDQQGDFADVIISLRADYRGYVRDKMNGILETRTEQVTRARINTRLLNLISELEEMHAAPIFDDEENSIEPTTDTPSSPTEQEGLTTVLFFAANPQDTGRLRLDVELREVREALQAATYRETIQVKALPAARPKDLRLGLLRNNPRILHFSGHGVRGKGAAFAEGNGSERGALNLTWEDDAIDPGLKGGIALEDENGNTKIVGGDVLAGLIKLFPSIECVILNACYSEVQAKAIIPHGPCVIGMNTAVPDKTAILFARAFYEALGEKRSLPDAFAYAKTSIDLDGLTGGEIPQLICP